ncbi:MAG: oleate hydratase [Balneolaceae bacterium]|nr:oleate hydratase [Balneolaceae bacterium]
MKIGIIGAGIGGLSAAVLLAKDGHEVSIYEKNEGVGGKMNQVRAKGYRFDTGPSLLTIPELLSGLFSQCGENMDDYLQLEPLDPLCRYFYPNKTVFDNFDDLEQALAEVRRIAARR